MKIALRQMETAPCHNHTHRDHRNDHLRALAQCDRGMMASTASATLDSFAKASLARIGDTMSSAHCCLRQGSQITNTTVLP